MPSIDSKLALAKEIFYNGRLDISEASYEDLIKVSGIGLKSVENIVKNKIRTMNDVKKLFGKKFIHVSLFISVNGR